MADRGREAPSSKAHREFVSEAEEILERMRDDLSQLAEAVEQQAEADPEVVNRLFRLAHSLKGLSGMFGLARMSDLAHHLEDLLDGLRMGRLSLGPELLGLFDEAARVVAEALGATGPSPEIETRIGSLTERIAVWQPPEAPEAPEAEELQLSESILRALTEYEEHRLRENRSRGRGIYVVDVDFEIASFEEGLAEVSRAVKEIGEILSTLPSPGDTPDSQIRFSLLTATDLPAAELARRLEIPESDIEVAAPPRQGPTPEAASMAPVRLPDASSAEPPSLKSISDTVRVDIRKLDELMNLVGDLAIDKGAIEQLSKRLASDKGTRRAGVELEKIHRKLERKLQELQAGVLDVRMVPLRQVFDKLSRVVRRLRLDLRKDVRLEVRGADTELDKLIVEELVDPLMHVVRNAFDHAIEPESERLERGKPASGCIQLEALQRGNDVVIVVSDDGRGIDADAVLERARHAGLVPEGAELGRKEILQLVFKPGLTTRDEVTETSGRGVGMDVVRANIAALGGMVEIDSVPGRGTTLTITLPITLAIIQALLVGVGEQIFAVPLNSIRETLIVEPSEIQLCEGREILDLRGEPLPLRRLASEFGIEGRATARGTSDKMYVVVLGIGDSRLGLIVERMEGQQDTVIKPIQGPVREVRGIAGATQLGERGAVLVLDVSALVADLGHRSET